MKTQQLLLIHYGQRCMGKGWCVCQTGLLLSKAQKVGQLGFDSGSDMTQSQHHGKHASEMTAPSA